jgi:DNA-binding winged helix-turn-helix (wHTH) protein
MRLTFGSWTLDVARRLLLRDGSPAPLSPKAFDLLTLLAEHDERAFSKAELHQHLWPNTFVSDGSLTILVAEIREVLQDDAQRPEFVRTVQRFGYAFCAAVTKETPSKTSSFRGVGWVVWGDKCVRVAEGETILGRSVAAGVRLDVPGVSRRHARIAAAPGGAVTIEDLGSRNGTYVRGEPITGAIALADGDEIRLGPVAVVFRIESPEGSTVPMS